MNVPAAPLTAFSERVSYDANGNITTYNRKAGGTNIEMDNLTYGYHSNTNKLRIVNDAVAATNYTEDIDNQTGTLIPNPALPGQNYAANYQYDASGNLISDQSQGSAITWNTYGKVKQVVRTGTTASTLAFGYDAMQQRIVKTFVANGNTTKTYYIRDAQGNVMATYDLTNNQLILKEMNLYGSSRLGTLNPFFQTFPAPAGGMANSLGNRQYELTNHLGNVMATIRDTRTAVDTDANGTANYFTANVASAQEYYPFGMTMPGRVVSGAVGYRWGFGGHEKDDEVNGPGNHLAFGDYGYDPRIGRRWNVDPKTNEIAGLSPYVYALDNPIVYIDKEGDIPILPFLLKAGTAGAADMLTQAAMAYFFDPKVESVEQAFEKVDWIQVARSSVEGLIPWRTPGGKLGKAAATAVGDVIQQGITKGSKYTADQAMLDFASGLMSDLGGGELGDLVSKYGSKGVARGLSKMGFDDKKIEEMLTGSGTTWKGTVDYSDLDATDAFAHTRGPGKKFYPSQKDLIREKNRKSNNGYLRDDDTGEFLNAPVQDKSGVPTDMKSAQVDHKQAKNGSPRGSKEREINKSAF